MDQIIIRLNLHQLAVLSHAVGYLKGHIDQLEQHIMRECQIHDDANKPAAPAAEAPAPTDPIIQE